MSQFLKHLFKLSGTTLAMSTVSHPQTDGQSKAVNCCLEMYLCCFTYNNSKAWSKFLSWGEFWYNTSYHLSTGMPLFRFCRAPLGQICLQFNSTDPLDLREMLQQRDLIESQLKQHLLKVQHNMKIGKEGCRIQRGELGIG